MWVLFLNTFRNIRKLIKFFFNKNLYVFVKFRSITNRFFKKYNTNITFSRLGYSIENFLNLVKGIYHFDWIVSPSIPQFSGAECRHFHFQSGWQYVKLCQKRKCIWIWFLISTACARSWFCWIELNAYLKCRSNRFWGLRFFGHSLGIQCAWHNN